MKNICVLKKDEDLKSEEDEPLKSQEHSNILFLKIKNFLKLISKYW